MDWNREGKQAARQYLLENISFEGEIDYIGLPASRAIFERQLYYKFNVRSLHLFEKDKTICEELSSNLINEKLLDCQVKLPAEVNVYLNSINNFSSFIEDFNFAWFDYCGPITMANLKAMSDAFNVFLKNSYKEGYLAFTFMVGRETEEVMSMINKYSISSDDSNLSEAYLKRISFLRILISSYCDKKGLGYNLQFFSYRDGVPMFLLLLEFKEGRKKTVTIEELFTPSLAPKIGRPSVPVIINGDYYSSIKMASEALSISPSTITTRIKNIHITNYQYA